MLRRRVLPVQQRARPSTGWGTPTACRSASSSSYRAACWPPEIARERACARRLDPTCSAAYQGQQHGEKEAWRALGCSAAIEAQKQRSPRMPCPLPGTQCRRAFQQPGPWQQRASGAPSEARASGFNNMTVGPSGNGARGSAASTAAALLVPNRRVNASPSSVHGRPAVLGVGR